MVWAGTQVDILRGEHMRSALELHATICLVDVKVLESDPDLFASEGFKNQVSIADILVGHKTDLASEEQKGAFLQWASGLFPSKVPTSAATPIPLSPTFSLEC
eukprot:98290-Prorocentrum_minimum.AAC.2